MKNEYEKWLAKARLRQPNSKLEKFAYLIHTNWDVIMKNDMLPETVEEWEDCYKSFESAMEIADKRRIVH